MQLGLDDLLLGPRLVHAVPQARARQVDNLRARARHAGAPSVIGQAWVHCLCATERSRPDTQQRGRRREESKQMGRFVFSPTLGRMCVKRHDMIGLTSGDICACIPGKKAARHPDDDCEHNLVVASPPRLTCKWWPRAPTPPKHPAQELLLPLGPSSFV